MDHADRTPGRPQIAAALSALDLSATGAALAEIYRRRTELRSELAKLHIEMNKLAAAIEDELKAWHDAQRRGNIR